MTWYAKAVLQFDVDNKTSVVVENVPESAVIKLEYKKNDIVALAHDETLMFKDSVYRQGVKGERFTVLLFQHETHKVYLSSTNSDGSEIALNVGVSAITLIQSGVNEGDGIGSSSSSNALPNQDNALADYKAAELKKLHSPEYQKEERERLKEIWNQKYGEYHIAPPDNWIESELRNINTTIESTPAEMLKRHGGIGDP